ncbi:hypothetical protein NKH77_06685 [Streptomyces sp. M19]
MRQQTHKRSRFVNKTVALGAVVILGGGAAAVIAATASASNSGRGTGRGRPGHPVHGHHQLPGRGRPAPERTPAGPGTGQPEPRSAGRPDRQGVPADDLGQAGPDAVLNGLSRERAATIGNIADAIGGRGDWSR